METSAANTKKQLNLVLSYAKTFKKINAHDSEQRLQKSQLPKSKDLGLCEAHAKRPLHKLNGFLQ